MILHCTIEKKFNMEPPKACICNFTISIRLQLSITFATDATFRPEWMLASIVYTRAKIDLSIEPAAPSIIHTNRYHISARCQLNYKHPRLNTANMAPKSNQPRVMDTTLDTKTIYIQHRRRVQKTGYQLAAQHRHRGPAARPHQRPVYGAARARIQEKKQSIR